MGLKKIVEGAYLIALGFSNAVLLDGGPELALVDAGFPDKASLVFDAIRRLGRTPRDLRHLTFHARSSRFASTGLRSDMAGQSIRARRNTSAANGDG